MAKHCEDLEKRPAEQAEQSRSGLPRPVVFKRLADAISRDISDRAYFLSQNAAFVAAAPPHLPCSLWCWLVAELTQLEIVNQRIQHRAYELWQEECHRLEDSQVHGNDLHHWFLAENEIIEALESRCEQMTDKSEIQSPDVADSADDLTCAQRESTVEGQMRSLDKVSPRGKQAGSHTMTQGKDANTGDTPVRPRGRFTYINLDRRAAPLAATTAGQLSDDSDDKLVVTDEDETAVLAVVSSLDELDREVRKPSFVARLTEITGGEGGYVVHRDGCPPHLRNR